MMTSLLVAVVLFQKAGPVMEDQEDLTGEWKIVRVELGLGKPNRLEELAKGGPVSINCSNLIFGKGGPMATKFKYKEHSGDKPKQIDFITENGDVVLGIYRLEKDVLIICTENYPKKKRPTEFKISPDSDAYWLLELQRKQAK
jgi:uncharacterized protein (TIGR03067 family)